MKRVLLLATATSLALSTPALAQPDDDTDVDEVIVTATRLDQPIDVTPGAYVIDQTRIEASGAVFVPDLLGEIPGVSLYSQGAPGGVTSVRLRGAAQDKTLVLLDGVPLNDPSQPSGGFDFAGLELADIARIEVLNGPQGSLWGSDAIGGVIAFTTREVNGVRAEAEAGSYDTLRGRLAAGVANDTYAFGAWVSRFDTNGISAADEADVNLEDDGFENTTIGARGRYAFTPDVQIDGSLRWSKSDAEIDGFPAPTFALADTLDISASEQWSGFARLKASAFGLSHQFSLSASDIARETAFSSLDADRQVWRWQADGLALGEALSYAFGAEREDTEGSVSDGTTIGLGTTSVFGVARYDLSERFSVTGGLRWDDTDDFGAETTGRLSAAYDLDGGFTLSGAIGTGFKAPSISQAVCDFCFSPDPFPVLTPESADSAEIALGWGSVDGRLQGRATVYRLDVEDQIVFGSAGAYVNIDRTRTDGIELEGRADLGSGFDLTLAYAWTDARDESDGARLLRVPEHAASATLGWSGERLSGALTVRTEGDQDDSDNGVTAVREGFITANVNGAYQLTDQVALTARIENLADERYQQVLGYGEPGRSGYVGIRLRY